MIKKLLVLLTFSFVLTQQYSDVIYLKNGSEIHGEIIEQQIADTVSQKSGQTSDIRNLERELSDLEEDECPDCIKYKKDMDKIIKVNN